MALTVGVLALQGGFAEHLSCLRKAAAHLEVKFNMVEVRTPEQLATCHALVIPGGESTTLSLLATQSGLLGPLRDFVKVKRKPTWGTCAGLIMLSEEASSAKRGGQELIGGLDVRVHRNHFGRQKESFVTDLNLAFLAESLTDAMRAPPFPCVFIRAPVVDKLLADNVEETSPENGADFQSLPSPATNNQTLAQGSKIEVLGILLGRHASNKAAAAAETARSVSTKGDGDIVALRQGNVFGTSFHPELTEDIRIHLWWLEQVVHASMK
ncbi:class I glutamine amidotransferase-like protein [Pseudomassariella vexata]|uniref:glutaminase n=1 Tax=Pseudomassariella vexata TaxID=1141098 RepID=A0A1Y2DK76_9PEZI|nr:class I glutamine amidotransferase-like protein [Pseudomassariella vexata]ORY59670.1 class I glutamine amidotransferase-like protein [Pseudomassariella vexata]